MNSPKESKTSELTIDKIPSELAAMDSSPDVKTGFKTTLNIDDVTNQLEHTDKEKALTGREKNKETVDNIKMNNSNELNE